MASTKRAAGQGPFYLFLAFGAVLLVAGALVMFFGFLQDDVVIISLGLVLALAGAGMMAPSALALRRLGTRLSPAA